MDDGSLEDNVESFLSHDDADPRDRVARCSDVSKGTINSDFFIDLSQYVWFCLSYTRHIVECFNTFLHETRLHFFGSWGYSCKCK